MSKIRAIKCFKREHLHGESNQGELKGLVLYAFWG